MIKCNDTFVYEEVSRAICSLLCVPNSFKDEEIKELISLLSSINQDAAGNAAAAIGNIAVDEKIKFYLDD